MTINDDVAWLETTIIQDAKQLNEITEHTYKSSAIDSDSIDEYNRIVYDLYRCAYELQRRRIDVVIDREIIYDCCETDTLDDMCHYSLTIDQHRVNS